MSKLYSLFILQQRVQFYVNLGKEIVIFSFPKCLQIEGRQKQSVWQGVGECNCRDIWMNIALDVLVVFNVLDLTLCYFNFTSL